MVFNNEVNMCDADERWFVRFGGGRTQNLRPTRSQPCILVSGTGKPGYVTRNIPMARRTKPNPFSSGVVW